MSGFGADQGTGATVAAVLRSTGEPGKASPIRGGGRTEKRIRRREPGKIVAVWSSISQRPGQRAFDAAFVKTRNPYSG